MESRALPVPDGLDGTRADAALAKLLGFSRTFAADVVDAVQPVIGRPVELPMSEPDAHSPDDDEPHADERARIVRLLGPSPVGIDDLIRLAGVPAAVARTVLFELELAGRLERHGGGMVSLL